MKDPVCDVNFAVNSRVYNLAMCAFNQDSEALQLLLNMAEEGNTEAELCLFHPEKFFDPCLHMRR